MQEHQEHRTEATSSSSILLERVEKFVRECVQHFLQARLEEEGMARWPGDRNSRGGRRWMRLGDIANGYGKARRLALTIGTITVRRLAERVVSRVLPLFQRRTQQGGELRPRLDLHGLALGDFEMALRGLLGDAAPLSSASLARLKAQWHLECEAWE